MGESEISGEIQGLETAFSSYIIILKQRSKIISVKPFIESFFNLFCRFVNQSKIVHIIIDDVVDTKTSKKVMW